MLTVISLGNRTWMGNMESMNLVHNLHLLDMITKRLWNLIWFTLQLLWSNSVFLAFMMKRGAANGAWACNTNSYTSRTDNLWLLVPYCAKGCGRDCSMAEYSSETGCNACRVCHFVPYRTLEIIFITGGQIIIYREARRIMENVNFTQICKL